MNTQELKRLREGLQQRLAKSLEAPLSPAMLALLAQLKAAEKKQKKTIRDR
jgi:hypothetical protein